MAPTFLSTRFLPDLQAKTSYGFYGSLVIAAAPQALDASARPTRKVNAPTVTRAGGGGSGQKRDIAFARRNSGRIGRIMSKAKTTRKLVPFDAARYLTDDDMIAEYVSAVLEMGEPGLLHMALSDVARARGVALSIAGMHL